MKHGDRVTMINCREAETYAGRIWTVRSEPWALGRGEVVVKLEGKSGGFAVRCLQIVEGNGDDD